MHFQKTANGFELAINGSTVLRHSTDAPCIFVGKGEERMDMYRGNFDIEDYVVERVALTHAELEGDRITLSTAHGQPAKLRLSVVDNSVEIEALDPSINRFWLRVAAEKDDASGAVASRCPTSICAGASSHSGHRSRASAATRQRSSPSKRTSLARRAATTTTPTIRNRPMSPRVATRCMWNNGLFCL